MKVFEGCSIALFTYVNGHLRQITGNYDWVSSITILNSLIGVSCAIAMQRIY